MRKFFPAFLILFFCVGFAGCGDGTLEIKSKTNTQPIIIEKTTEKVEPIQETKRTESVSHDGTTVQKTETTTTR